MCTFNASTWVQDQLDSIAAQTRKPDELVISDDQSTDNTRDILRAFAAVAPFPVHIFVNEQKGLAKNFENTFRHCTGEIIVESDHDDAWSVMVPLAANIQWAPRIDVRMRVIWKPTGATNSCNDFMLNMCKCRGGSSPRQFDLKMEWPKLFELGATITRVPFAFKSL